MPQTDSRIAAEFERIRDIPYAIPISPDEPDYCCSGKMKALKAWCDANGYESRYRVCAFRWSDMGLPPELLAVPHADGSTHVYLEIRIDREWIDVDPTWDAALVSVLPVNGREDRPMRVAVPALSLRSHEESARIMAGEWDDADIRANGEFYRALNGWLESCRIASAR